MTIPTPVAPGVQSVAALADGQSAAFLAGQTTARPAVDARQVSLTLTGAVDLERAAMACQLLGLRHEVLRTAVAYRGTPRPVQAIFADRGVPVEVVDLSARDAITRGRQSADLKEQALRQGFDVELTPLFRVLLIRQSPGQALMVWTYHPILLDHDSLDQLLRDFRIYQTRLARGALPTALAWEARARALAGPRFHDWVRGEQRQPQDEAYWNAVVGSCQSDAIRPPALTVRAHPDADDLTVTQDTRLDEGATTAIRAAAERAGVAVATLVDAAWGLVLQRVAGLRDVVFGRVVSERPAMRTWAAGGRAIPAATKAQPAAGSWPDRVVGQGDTVLPIRVGAEAGDTVGAFLARVGAAEATAAGRRAPGGAVVGTLVEWLDAPATSRGLEPFDLPGDGLSTPESPTSPSGRDEGLWPAVLEADEALSGLAAGPGPDWTADPAIEDESSPSEEAWWPFGEPTPSPDEPEAPSDPTVVELAPLDQGWAMEPAPIGAAGWGAVASRLRLDSTYVETSVPLRVTVTPVGGELSLQARSDPQLYAPADAERALGWLARALVGLASDPDQRLDAVDIAPPGEMAWVLRGFDASPPGALPEVTLTSLIAGRLAEDPDAPALWSNGRTYSRDDLDRASQVVEGWLAKAGVGRGDKVAVWAVRCPELIPTLLAVLRLGAAYVLVDPAAPAARRAAIVQDAEPAAYVDFGEALVDLDDLEGVAAERPELTVEADIWPESQADEEPESWDDQLSAWLESTGASPASASEPEDAEAAEVTARAPAEPSAPEPSDAAYVFYLPLEEERSTEPPVGIAVSQRALVEAGLDPALDAWFEEEHVRFLPVTDLMSHGFATAWLLPLVRGGTLVWADAAELETPDAFAALVLDSAANVVLATPGSLDAVTGDLERLEAFATVRAVIVDGPVEECALGRAVTCTGPTWWLAVGRPEVAGWITVGQITDPEQVDGGRPLAFAPVYVVAGGQPRGIGQVGELCVGGSGLADGYRHRDDLTREVFVDGPWGRVVRTGRLARWLPSGHVEWLGDRASGPWQPIEFDPSQLDDTDGGESRFQVPENPAGAGDPIDLADWLPAPAETGGLGDTEPQPPLEGPVAATPLQRRFLAADYARPSRFSRSIALRARDRLDQSALAAALGALCARHDTLRTICPFGDLYVRPPAEADHAWHLEVVHLPDGPADLGAVERRLAQGPALDLMTGPLLHATVFRGDPTGDRLILSAHQLVVDDWSWRVLVADLAEAYEDALAEVPITLTPPAATWADWTQALDEGAAVLPATSLWPALEALAGAVDASDVRGRLGAASGAAAGSGVGHLRQRLDLDEAVSARLLEVLAGAGGGRPDASPPPAAGPTPESRTPGLLDILTAALALSVRFAVGGDRIAVEQVANGRDALVDVLDLSRTVGWLDAAYPVVVDAAGTPETALASAVAARSTQVGGPLAYGLVSDHWEASAASSPALLTVVHDLRGVAAADTTGLFSQSDWPTGPTLDAATRPQHAVVLEATVRGEHVTVDLLTDPAVVGQFLASTLGEGIVVELGRVTSDLDPA